MRVWSLGGLLLGVFVSMVVAIPKQETVTKVGDTAPPLSVDKWLQGEPIEKLDKGKVYVVEFWGTWCTPCLQSIPHLNALQKQHAKDGLVIIGVASHEFNGLDALTNFLRKHGKKIEYPIAFDVDPPCE